jgi:hypothetical protein
MVAMGAAKAPGGRGSRRHDSRAESEAKFTEGDGQEVYYGHASINTDPPMRFSQAGAAGDQPARCDRNSIRISRRQKEAISLAMCRWPMNGIVLRLVFVTVCIPQSCARQHVFKGSLRIPMSEGQ